MGRSDRLGTSSCRGSWVWSWRNWSCGDWGDGSANNGTVSCYVSCDGGTRGAGGVCGGWEIEVVRGREIKVRWYVSTVQMSKRGIAIMQTGRSRQGVAWSHGPIGGCSE